MVTWGMVRQWQEMFYEGALSHDSPCTVLTSANWPMPTESPSRKVTHPDEIKDAIDFAGKVQDGPVILEFVVQKEDMVYPMVSPGQALHKMVQRPYSTEKKGEE